MARGSPDSRSKASLHSRFSKPPHGAPTSPELEHFRAEVRHLENLASQTSTATPSGGRPKFNQAGWTRAVPTHHLEAAVAKWVQPTTGGYSRPTHAPLFSMPAAQPSAPSAKKPVQSASALTLHSSVSAGSLPAPSTAKGRRGTPKAAPNSTNAMLAAARRSAGWTTLAKSPSGLEIAEAATLRDEIEQTMRLPRVRLRGSGGACSPHSDDVPALTCVHARVYAVGKP